MGGDRGWNNSGEVAGAPGGELSDIRAVLETATAALEEIRSQVQWAPRDNLEPVVVRGHPRYNPGCLSWILILGYNGFCYLLL